MSTFILDPETLTPRWNPKFRRTCQTCGEIFPETERFFPTTGRGYLRRSCRRCVAEEERRRRHEARELGLLPVEPLRELLHKLADAWKAEDKRFDDFAESVGLRSRALFRIFHENAHVQFDVADRVLCNTAYSMHDLYPEWYEREDEEDVEAAA